MFVIAFACVFSTGTGLWFMTTNNDARLNRASRKALFRGELKDEKIHE